MSLLLKRNSESPYTVEDRSDDLKKLKMNNMTVLSIFKKL